MVVSEQPIHEEYFTSHVSIGTGQAHTEWWNVSFRVFVRGNTPISAVVMEMKQDEHTTSIQVPVPVVPFSASEVTSEPLSSLEVTTGVPAEEEHNGDTEPELPIVTPEIEQGE